MSDLLWGLTSYGGERHAEALEDLAAEPGFKEEWRARYRKAAGEIRRYLK